eukprot:TRINITY_DN1893_c0_g1_i1.p1 TRINITY_DN1893_c0_g1~~TRINITY_DN1893_c0_g1_i1.p1  ORF type:complete len:549 (-),score=125.51 TRINITY_DN1893_c0_g1_i1:219-1865(-)
MKAISDMLGELPYADLVVQNAIIYTSDPKLPWAEAMAVRRGRIVGVGNLSSVQEFIGKGTWLLDLEEKMVVPGFIDSHVHFISGGLQMGQVDLRKVKSKQEFIMKIERAASTTERGNWILGGGWNDDNWGGELPEASWIDNVSEHNPVWLVRMDGHMGLANTVALRRAKIDTTLDNIAGGAILKTAQGAPTGLLVDAAMQLLLPQIPEPTIQERRDAMLRASKLALSRGVTGVVDFGRNFPGMSKSKVWEDFSDVYKWADKTGHMLLRVWTFFPMETWSQVADLLKESGRVLSQWLYIGGAKSFADGSLGSNSALFFEPYSDDESNHGLHVADPEQLLENITKSDAAAIQIAVHAIGDKANAMLLSMNDDLIALNGQKDRRFRIEHAQHLAAESLDAFGRNRVIASMQPAHLLDDAHSASKKLGERRAFEESYLFKSLLQKKTQLAFGSDWPVADLNPIEGIRAATKRIPPGWKHPWIESECISIEAAVNSYTSSAAFAIFMEHDLGSLLKGKWADFVVLSNNIWNITDQNDSPYVLATYVSGVQAYP